jgi:dihydrofolate reductase
MKTQYYAATSIDGYLADANHALDWLLQFDAVDGIGALHSQFVDRVGAAAMGASTYTWVVEHEGLLDAPSRWPYDVPTWVFSHRALPAVEGADLRFVAGDVRPVHADMIEAANGKNVWLVGGGALVGQFYDHGLLDEIILSVVPVMLGQGTPLLPRAITRPPLKLTGVQQYGDVFAVLTYEVQRASRPETRSTT